MWTSWLLILNKKRERERRHLSCKFLPSWNGSKCHTRKWTSKHPEIYSFTCLSSKSFDWNARCTLVLSSYFFSSNTFVWNAYRLYLYSTVHCQGQNFPKMYCSALSFQLIVFLDFNNNTQYSPQKFNAHNRALAICFLW